VGLGRAFTINQRASGHLGNHLGPRGLRSKRVMLSLSSPLYAPMRQSRRLPLISQDHWLYSGSLPYDLVWAATETFPTFTAVLSTRAVDHTPVGPLRPPVAFGEAIPGFLRLSESRHPQRPPLPAIPDGVMSRRCIVRFMLRPVCLPGPPDWLQQGAAICPTPCLLRTVSLPLLASSVAGRRWESS